MKKSALAALLCFATFLSVPLSAQAQTCQPAASYSVPGTYSGSFTISMASCAASDGSSASITGTYSFSNYADAAGDSINGSYNFSIAYSYSGSIYDYTYTMNGGPVTYSQNQMEIYYDQFSYSMRLDASNYQVSYSNSSGGWRINGVYYPASEVYKFADFSGSAPTIDPNALGNLVNPPADTTPDAFSFGAQGSAAPGALVESDAITVRGISGPAAISISGGEYSINGGPWTSAAGTVTLGNQVMMRLTAPSGYGATGTATLSIGGVSASFSVTTRTSVAVSTVSQVFSNAGTAATVQNGVVRVIATPAAPLQFTSGATLDAVVALDTDSAIPVASGSATLNYTRGSSDTAFQIRTIGGSPALAPISGHVTIAAPTASSSAPVTIPVTGNTSGSATLSTGSADTRVTAGPNASRNIVVAVTGGPVHYSTLTTSRAPRASGTLPASFDVYPGEAVLADESGAAGQVRLGSFAQDGSQAGDYIAGIPNAASTLNVPLVTGSSQRFNNDWATLVGQAIAAKFGLGTYQSLTQDASSGMLTLTTSHGVYRFLPVGSLALADAALNPIRAVSVGAIAANLTAILDNNLSFAVAPATAYADLKTALQGIGGSLEVLGDGVIKATLGSTSYIAQPAAATVQGTYTPGVCPGFDTVGNQLALCDGTGRRQVLRAAFADTDTLRGTFRTDLSLPELTVSNNDGNGTYAAMVGTTPYTLTPDFTLTAPPTAQAGKLWWSDAATGKIYIRYPSGAAQGFTLQ